VGTLTLVAGILILLTGLGSLLWAFAFTAFSEFSTLTIISFGLGIINIGVGSLLISKYDADKKEQKNSSQVIQEETQFWVCPHCGGDTQNRNGKQFCSKCNVYL